MIYLGFPIQLDEVLRILGFAPESMGDDDLNKYFDEKNVSIRLLYIDKGLYVFGYKFDELYETYNPHKFVPFNLFMRQLEYYRNMFSSDLAALNADTSRIKISGLEYTDNEDMMEMRRMRWQKLLEEVDEMELSEEVKEEYIREEEERFDTIYPLNKPPRYIENAEPFMFDWAGDY